MRRNWRCSRRAQGRLGIIRNKEAFLVFVLRKRLYNVTSPTVHAKEVYEELDSHY